LSPAPRSANLSGPMSLRSLLIPEQSRQFPARVWFRVTCRSLHILCIGAYVGGTLYGGPEAELSRWFHGAAATGAALILADLYGSFIYMAELRGMAMFAKLIVLGAATGLPDQRLGILIGLIVFSSVVSHMPSRWRHWTLGGGAPTREQRRAGRG